jgi:methyl-accepting chemotaxis protein
MCSSLTDQVRSIAKVTTAVAKGDLTQKIEIQVEGEMSTLKGTVNSMVDQLSAFASEVTRVALEVGTQGILGGQARVEGVQGTWADLTRNVNVSTLLVKLILSGAVNDVHWLENGEQFDGPGSFDLRGHKSGGTW